MEQPPDPEAEHRQASFLPERNDYRDRYDDHCEQGMRHPPPRRPVEHEHPKDPIDHIREHGSDQHEAVVDPASPEGHVDDQSGDAHVPEDHSSRFC